MRIFQHIVYVVYDRYAKGWIHIYARRPDVSLNLHPRRHQRSAKTICDDEENKGRRREKPSTASLNIWISSLLLCIPDPSSTRLFVSFQTSVVIVYRTSRAASALRYVNRRRGRRSHNTKWERRHRFLTTLGRIGWIANEEIISQRQHSYSLQILHNAMNHRRLLRYRMPDLPRHLAGRHHMDSGAGTDPATWRCRRI